jgi:hypothetical protein
MEKPTSAVLSASDRDCLTQLLEALNEPALVIGAGTSKDTKLGDYSVHVSLGKLAEGRAFHNNATRDKNATVLGNSLSSHNVVTCNHANIDTGMLTVLNGLLDAVSQGILDTDNSEESHVFKDVLEDSLAGVVIVTARLSRWPTLKIAIDETDGSQRAGSIRGDDLFECLAIVASQGRFRKLLGGVRDDLVASLQEDLRRSLDIHSIAVLSDLSNSRRAFDSRVEGDNLDNVGVGAAF